ncbi:hydroxypyruvate isomerase family protein [Devosia sp.]|uniref:hydroxypyruvate isomerase family protein n=1 Tax=Devosia sp. TaxID=1871048 RepID=UPI0029319D4F|nr:TIM barrel protein [Devosia sp.]
MLYPEHGFLERFGAAAADGFRGVEFVSPYEFPPEEVAAAAKAAGVEVVLFNSPAGDWAKGERGIACHPGREDEFADGIETVLRYAPALGCRKVHVMAGIVPSGGDPGDAEWALVGNLRLAAARLGAHGIMALLEPINQVDMPGFAVSTTDHAERVMAKVGHDNLWLQYDFYHIEMTQRRVLQTFERLLPIIGHVQVADVPGRHEPGTGRMDYPGIFAGIEKLGYDGWVGAEYRPVAGTSAGLGWMRGC